MARPSRRPRRSPERARAAIRVSGAALPLLAWAASGCGGPCEGAPTLPVPAPAAFPAERPDVVLLSVSGRMHGGLTAWPPACNEAYLAQPGDAPAAIAAQLVAAGRTVFRRDYISALRGVDDDADGAADERLGLLQLLEDLDEIARRWIAGSAEPARIVLVCHSHGCVWAHVAASLRPGIPIDLLASFDGICTGWTMDHGDSIAAAEAAGTTFAWDIAEPCGVWEVPGGDAAYNTEDVAFDNVRWNLEVQSADCADCWLRDDRDNVRLDGTRRGVETFRAETDGHSGVHLPGGEGLSWVLERLAEGWADGAE